ncbi:DUF411 domain-containing protein [Thalassomonas viridans]|uniref:DUF411 domain-containing protein n=1 Tax=Thalassomonas viridans TaxID=137584 RepID=A0AAF0C9J1_9GAMM|nr:DUF411 domain-containing protein [Thalassomonas viridans]WDE05818.1 DUF411 domain-containing protein [Thalassomonas viridans]
MFFIAKLTPVAVRKTLAVSFLALLGACSEVSELPRTQDNAVGAETVATIAELKVYKRESCGCCQKWIDHIDATGFSSRVYNHNALSAFKIEQGINPRHHSCHTAISEQGYVFEGHIPAKFIQQFLHERAGSKKDDQVLGLAVPAMPIGSPGMEVDEQFMPYQILLLKGDGSSEVYAKVNTYREQF